MKYKSSLVLGPEGYEVCMFLDQKLYRILPAPEGSGKLFPPWNEGTKLGVKTSLLPYMSGKCFFPSPPKSWYHTLAISSFIFISRSRYQNGNLNFLFLFHPIPAVSRILLTINFILLLSLNTCNFISPIFLKEMEVDFHAYYVGYERGISFLELQRHFMHSLNIY